MKRAYVKPGMYVENFVLSQSIAAGCEGVNRGECTLGVPTTGSKETCGWDNGVFTLWAQSSSCNHILGPDTAYDGFCYNNPNGGIAIFNYS